MDALYLFACSIAWTKEEAEEAGWELVRALRSPDPCVKALAKCLMDKVLATAGRRDPEAMKDSVVTGLRVALMQSA